MPMSMQCDLPVRSARRLSSAPHRRLAGHDGGVTDLAVVDLPTGEQLLVSVGTDGSGVVWDPERGREVARLVGHHGAVNAVCSLAAPDRGARVVTGGDDGTLRFWDPCTGEPCGDPIRTGFDVVTEVLAWRCGTREFLAAVVGRDDAGDTILVVDPVSSEPLQVVGEGNHELSHLGVLTIEGRQVLVALAADRERGSVSIRLWDAGTGETVLEPIAVPDDDAEAMIVVPLESGGSGLAVVLDERVIRVDPVTGDVLGGPLLHPENQTSAVTFFRAVSGEPRLVTVLSTVSELWDARFPSVMLWDPRSQDLLGRFPTGHLGRMDRVVVLGDGETVALACRDGSVRLWRFDEALGHPMPGPTGREGSGAPLDHVPEPGGAGLLLTTYHPAGVTGEDLLSSGLEYDLWDAATAELIGTLPGRFADAVAHQDASGRAAVLTLQEDGALTSWDPRTLTPTGTWATNTKGRWFLRPEPGGSRVACFGAGPEVDVWDLASGEHVATFRDDDVDHPCLEPEAVAWVLTPQGPQLVIAHVTHLTLWDPASGDLRSHRPEDGAALGRQLHPGPGWVAVGDHEQRIILVDATFMEVLAVLSCPEGIADVATLPDGRVVTCTVAGGIDLWDPRSGSRLARHGVGAEVRRILALPDGSLALGLVDGWSIVTLPATNPG